MMKTERLTVRPIEENDWQSIREIWIDFKNTEYVIYDKEKDTDPEKVIKRVAGWADATRTGTEHMFFVSCLEGEVIGFFSLNASRDGYEIEYGLKAKAQGHGYAKESLEAVLTYAKDLGARNIYAKTGLENLPSVGLLKSMGFERESTLPRSFHKDSEGNDIFFTVGNYVKKLYIPNVAECKVKIIEAFDLEWQPGWCKAVLTDINGEEHIFVDKLPIIDVSLEEAEHLPLEKTMRVDVIQESTDAVEIDTSTIVYIESTDEKTRFWVSKNALKMANY